MKIILITALLIVLGCKEDTTEPKTKSDSYISVTGDLRESYAAVAYFSISTYTSGDTTREYFTLIIRPKISGSNPLAMALLYKLNSEPPQVQNYQIGEYGFGSDIPENEFGGSFSGKNITDDSGYIMTTGNLNITAVTKSNIHGELEMSGYYMKLFEQDTTRIVDISGYFDATKIPEYSVYLYPRNPGTNHFAF
jgi:hypothetical protein